MEWKGCVYNAEGFRVNIDEHDYVYGYLQTPEPLRARSTRLNKPMT